MSLSPEQFEELSRKIGGVPKSGIKGPGGKGPMSQRRGEGKSPKGYDGEKTTAAALGGRVNNQRQWGSIGNPDITAGQFDIENKTGPVSIRKEIDEIVKKTPYPRKPGLVFDHNAEPWITVRLSDHVAFAKYVADKEGYSMVPNGVEAP